MPRMVILYVLSSYILALVLIALSWKYEEVQRTLQPWGRQAFTYSGWVEFVSLGLPGTIMLCSEWWAYEMLTVFASQLGTVEVAAQTIIIQTCSLASTVPLGFVGGSGVTCGQFHRSR